MTRRGATSLVGILPIDKPAGMTSHDVVARIRRATGEGRVGHAGTLDPMATGLLVVLIGAYARLTPYLTAENKCYQARITFGSETDTDDAEGAVTRTSDIPPAALDAEYARSVLSSFLGASLQTPPDFSAIKVGGKTAHREARAGSALELEPRDIEVRRADLLAVDDQASTWTVFFEVSKGTYIRSLARDIGRAVGSAAHLSALRRTSSGVLTLDDAHPLDQAVDRIAAGELDSLLADPIAPLALPVRELAPTVGRFGSAVRLLDGDPLREGETVTVTRDGVLAGIYHVESGRLVPEVVIPMGAAE